MDDFKPGIYRHYKGKDYRFISLARHSETEEWMVVYQALYGDYGIWVRPASMWSETVVLPSGEERKRFLFLRPCQENNQE